MVFWRAAGDGGAVPGPAMAADRRFRGWQTADQDDNTMNAHPEFDMSAEPLAPAAAALLVDLGIEPPIQPEGASPQALDRRGVSLRWLAACTLVGSCGAADRKSVV